MKGYVKVSDERLLAASIGFELRYDAGKAILEKGISDYYEKEYVGGSWLTRYFNRKKSKREFARSRTSAFGSWTDVLFTVLTGEERDELEWWCWTHKSEFEPIKVLYKLSVDGFAIVDNEMAEKIKFYENYLKEIK